MYSTCGISMVCRSNEVVLDVRKLFDTYGQNQGLSGIVMVVMLQSTRSTQRKYSIYLRKHSIYLKRDAIDRVLFNILFYSMYNNKDL